MISDTKIDHVDFGQTLTPNSQNQTTFATPENNKNKKILNTINDNGSMINILKIKFLIKYCFALKLEMMERKWCHDNDVRKQITNAPPQRKKKKQKKPEEKKKTDGGGGLKQYISLRFHPN